MGKYTLHNDLLVDEIVESHLAIIKDCVLRYIRPKALILSGSFGRGEGSIYKDGSNVQFFSDYEIGLVSGSPLARLSIDHVQRDIDQAIQPKVSLFWITPRRIRNNLHTNLSLGRFKPNIYMYELKCGSQLFHGNIDLHENQLDPSSLPIYEAILLVENRMMEVVERWCQEVTRIELAFSMAKLILACGDALLIKCGLYHYSYAERSKRFTHHFESEFSKVLGDEFLLIYQSAASFKLLPFMEYDHEVILANQKAVREACRHVLSVLSNNRINANYLLPNDSLDMTIVSPVQFFYQLGSLSILNRTYENTISAIKSWRAGKKIYWNLIPRQARHLSIVQLLYAIIPFLYFGLSIGGEGDYELLENAAYFGGWALGRSLHFKQEIERSLAISLITMWHVLN